MITKGMIENGIKRKVILLVTDPNMESGTVCKIGDNWFYFGGSTADELLPEEYLKRVPLDIIVQEIYGTLNDFRNDEDFKDEYDYYECILNLIP